MAQFLVKFFFAGSFLFVFGCSFLRVVSSLVEERRIAVVEDLLRVDTDFAQVLQVALNPVILHHILVTRVDLRGQGLARVVQLKLDASFSVVVEVLVLLIG